MLVGDYSLDGTLERIRSISSHAYICSAEPTNYTQATSTYALGVKNFGAGNAWGAPAARTPNGRKITSTPVTDGVVNTQGTGAFLAFTDNTGSRLVAVFQVASPQVVYVGNPWTANAFDFGLPNQ